MFLALQLSGSFFPGGAFNDPSDSLKASSKDEFRQFREFISRKRSLQSEKLKTRELFDSVINNYRVFL
jgi:hypothetical protein